jgi:hypothetical protein
MLSQTSVHRPAINKLDSLTAHNRCLRKVALGLNRLFLVVAASMMQRIRQLRRQQMSRRSPNDCRNSELPLRFCRGLGKQNWGRGPHFLARFVFRHSTRSHMHYVKLVTWDGWPGRRPDPFQAINRVIAASVRRATPGQLPAEATG